MRERSAQKERNHISNQENNQEQIQFPAQQELKHLRTRCGKVYALGNNRFRAVVQTTPVHEYDAATHQWVELSAEKRQQMAAQAHSPKNIKLRMPCRCLSGVRLYEISWIVKRERAQTSS